MHAHQWSHSRIRRDTMCMQMILQDKERSIAAPVSSRPAAGQAQNTHTCRGVVGPNGAVGAREGACGDAGRVK